MKQSIPTIEPRVQDGQDTPAPSATPAGTPHPQTHKWLVVIAVMLATALSALDANIVGTAIPTIVGQLHGLPLLPWLVASFMLTSTTTVPLFGKLSDIYGRKSVLLVGAGLFLMGSVLCGFAGSMEQLILFRAVQGIGAGCVVPVTLTLIGDLFTLEERARLQGIFSAVWGVSSVVGPVVGGLLVTTVGWPWIFFVNVPFGLASMAMIWRFLREPIRPAGSLRRIDFPGAITLTFGVAGVLLALSFGSTSGWFSAHGRRPVRRRAWRCWRPSSSSSAAPPSRLCNWRCCGGRTAGISALAGFLGLRRAVRRRGLSARCWSRASGRARRCRPGWRWPRSRLAGRWPAPSPGG